jgi:hypothetical protein
MRGDEEDGPRENDWLAEEDWLEAPTEEVTAKAPRRRPTPRPRGTPNRRLVALIAGASILLLVILIAVVRGGDDEPESTPTAPTETTAQPETEAAPPLQIPEAGTLGAGDSGPRVRRLQRALAQLGYAVTTDGEFGPGTTAAVQAFQEDAGLNADGVAGPATARAINAELATGG